VIPEGLPVVDAVAQAKGAQVVPDPLDKTEKAARQFEGLLMNVMLQALRKTVQPSGLFGDSGQTRSTYEYLLDQAVVDRAVASGHGWGLADRLRTSWSRLERITPKNDVPGD
jgi:Rod binding domain-containing protein